jgi:hypothetical protein
MIFVPEPIHEPKKRGPRKKVEKALNRDESTTKHKDVP